MFVIKPITQKEIETLMQKKVICNSHKGMVDNRGRVIGFYVTKNKTYIEDEYAKIAQAM